eukprot:jgi/Ulvmu1/4119/UM019_0098.1
MYALERGLAPGSFCQARSIGSWVPEYFGKKSKYTEGTDFLGTPKDHQQRIQHRPVSPDVLTLDGKHLHYKLPINAISSIANRVTGVGMSVGMMGAGFIALTGDLPGTMEYIKSCGPLLTIPLKGLIAFPIIYHYVAGIRHLMWDHSKIGDQAQKDSMLELGEVQKSSEYILYGSAGLSALLALYYYTV